ncbi:MAG: hypothetical protein ACI4QB_05010, partial [Eubacteriales bacterium]
LIVSGTKNYNRLPTENQPQGNNIRIPGSIHFLQSCIFAPCFRKSAPVFSGFPRRRAKLWIAADAKMKFNDNNMKNSPKRKGEFCFDRPSHQTSEGRGSQKKCLEDAALLL